MNAPHPNVPEASPSPAPCGRVPEVLTLLRSERVNSAPGGASQLLPAGTRVEVGNLAGNRAYRVAHRAQAPGRPWQRLGPFAIVPVGSLAMRASDELEVRASLYEAAGELERAVQAALVSAPKVSSDRRISVLENTVRGLEDFRLATVEYLRATGRGEDSGESEYERGVRAGRLVGMTEALRACNLDAMGGNGEGGQ